MQNRMGGQYQAIQKPDFVLKRADDLINTAMGSGEKEKRLALDQIHSHISIKRSKQQSVWNKTYEILMKRHLELCVDLKDNRVAKDGLHQYRNLCQVADPNSLETVALYLMELAEARCSAARTKANNVALAAAAQFTDLEQEESPESIMLASMTEEGSKDRTDREIIIPWLKFLWETYRAILELLYKNPKLERVYHKTCEKAFVFCRDYQRTMEFKRLCSLLHDHLTNLQKIPSSNSSLRVQRPAWEWSSDAIELHLQTRFSQLEVSTELELWNEGFKTVEEIYTIIEIGKRTPRPKIMATYYEKLMRIFFVSENHLFHAYCCYKYYCLSCESRTLSSDERTTMASTVLLSALCIPAVRDDGVNSSTSIANISLDDEDGAAYDKNQKMAKLLDFDSNPTRHSLLKDIVDKGLLEYVSSELKVLYYQMETKFQPLSLAKGIVNAIDIVKNHKTLNVYSIPLQRVAVLRVLLQLGHVFSTIKIDFLKKLLSPFQDVSYLEIEKIMVDGIARKQLQLKIDHSSGSLKFSKSISINSNLNNGSNNINDGNISVDNHVSILGCTLTKLRYNILSTSNAASDESKKRQEYLSKIASSVLADHEALNERKQLIENRKRNLETIQQTNEAKAIEDAKIAAIKKQEDEDERLRLDSIAREIEKKAKLMERMEVLRVQKELEHFNISKDETELYEMGMESRDMLLLEARAGAKKEKDDESRRVTEQAKRLDHITRAMRIEGAKALSRMYSENTIADKAVYDTKRTEVVEAMRVQHSKDLEQKRMLEKMQAFRSTFEASFIADQESTYRKKMELQRDRAIRETRHKLVARARRAAAEAAEEAEEAEARAAEEAERLAAEHAALRDQERREEEEARIRERLEEREREEEQRRQRVRDSEGGDRPRPTFGDRRRDEGGDDRPRPTFGDRRRDEGGDDRPRPTFGDRRRDEGGDRPRPTFGDRRRDEGEPEAGRADGAGGWGRNSAPQRSDEGTRPVGSTWKPGSRTGDREPRTGGGGLENAFGSGTRRTFGDRRKEDGGAGGGGDTGSSSWRK
jgi:translation initiation factor 3 subunit A